MLPVAKRWVLWSPLQPAENRLSSTEKPLLCRAVGSSMAGRPQALLRCFCIVCGPLFLLLPPASPAFALQWCAVR